MSDRDDYAEAPSDDEANPSDPGEPTDDKGQQVETPVNVGVVCCHGVGGDYEGDAQPYNARDPVQHPRPFMLDVPHAHELNRHIDRINELEHGLTRVIPTRAQVIHQDYRDIRQLRIRHAVLPVQANDVPAQRIRESSTLSTTGCQTDWLTCQLCQLVTARTPQELRDADSAKKS